MVNCQPQYQHPLRCLLFHRLLYRTRLRHLPPCPLLLWTNCMLSNVRKHFEGPSTRPDMQKLYARPSFRRDNSSKSVNGNGNEENSERDRLDECHGSGHHSRPRDQHHPHHNHPYLDSYSAHSLHSMSHPHSMYSNSQPPSHSSSLSSLSSYSSSSSHPYAASTSTSASSYPYPSPSGFRLSKSATTSSVGTPGERIRDRGYFGMSNERGDPEDVADDCDPSERDFGRREREREYDERDRDIKSKRRLSGPAWYT